MYSVPTDLPAFYEAPRMLSPRRHLQHLAHLFRNRFFWTGLAGLGAIGLGLYLLVDRVVMPGLTLHDAAVVVPDVMSLRYEDAAVRIEAVGLSAEQQILRKPNLPRDIVIDQRPPAGAEVKPGRRIWLTVNTGDTTTVAVPKVIGLSVREAQSRMVLLGLVVPEVLPDSIPSSHANTVTRQEPAAGRRVPLGSEASLWYSTGLGEAYVIVPSVVGLTTEEARSRLLTLRLRSVVLGEDASTTSPVVRDQSPAPGTRVREGIEVRLRLSVNDPDARP